MRPWGDLVCLRGARTEAWECMLGMRTPAFHRKKRRHHTAGSRGAVEPTRRQQWIRGAPYQSLLVRRRDKGENQWQTTTYRRSSKLGVVVDCESHLNLSAVPGRGPGPGHLHLVRAIGEARARIFLHVIEVFYRAGMSLFPSRRFLCQLMSAPASRRR